MYKYLLLCTLLIVQCEKSNIKPKYSNSSFQELFEVTNTLKIRGDQEQPIFTFGKPAKINNTYYFPDKIANIIYAYNKKGDLIYQFGGSGRGPGDLNNPMNLFANSAGEIIVNETGNLRFQKFSQNGTSLNLTYLPSFAYVGIPINNNPNLIWAVYPSQIGNSNILFHLVDLEEGVVTKHIGSYNEKETLLHGWIADADDKFLYIANVLDQEIKIFNIEDTNTKPKTIKINSINTTPFISDSKQYTESGQGLLSLLEKLNKEKYTLLSGIFKQENEIITLFKRNNFDDNYSEYFIDIYNLSGSLKYSGIDLEGELIRVNRDQLAVINFSENYYGEIILFEIEYK